MNLQWVAAVLLVVQATAAWGTDNVIKIGVLNDQSGVFADNGGRGSVAAARLAAEDFGNEVLGKKIEIISADHQNKPDVAAAKAREWFDNEGVDVVADGAASFPWRRPEIGLLPVLYSRTIFYFGGSAIHGLGPRVQVAAQTDSGKMRSPELRKA